jgi:hypothetical protein
MEDIMTTKIPRLLLAALGLTAVTAPAFVTPALAQAGQSYRAARQNNRADATDVDDRMGRTIAAITSAESRGAITHKRANTLRDMIDRMRADYVRNKSDQGFVSAGELASYNRSLNEVDREITKRRR